MYHLEALVQAHLGMHLLLKTSKLNHRLQHVEAFQKLQRAAFRRSNGCILILDSFRSLLVFRISNSTRLSQFQVRIEDFRTILSPKIAQLLPEIATFRPKTALFEGF